MRLVVGVLVTVVVCCALARASAWGETAPPTAAVPTVGTADDAGASDGGARAATASDDGARAATASDDGSAADASSSSSAADASSSSSAADASSSSSAADEHPVVHVGTNASLTLAGYVQTFYQWNFNQPSNGITNYRGFDDRHNSFTLDNVVFDALGALGPVSAHLVLQVGLTGQTYYLAEPSSPATAGAGASNADAWKFLQQANVGWRAPLGRGLLLEAGLFTSPVGPEGFAIHEQWNWSRSNLFFGLPFYHTGVRATYPLTERVSAMVMVCNGWNSVVDNNSEKSVMGSLAYVIPDRVNAQVLYLGGVERPPGAPEGRAWRNLFDAYVSVTPMAWLSLMAHGDAGFEPNAFGTSWWAAGALYARLHPWSWLYLAARGDYFYESVASSAAGTASPLFWPSPWVSSATATLDVRPHDNVSVRLEYRHDEAQGATYFRGAVVQDPMTMTAVPNARSQDTVTLGATAWF